jgi:hypothetical protein
MQDNKSKADDMIELMRSGYGLPIDSFRDHILDVLFRVDHAGGKHAIKKASEAIVIIVEWCASLTSMIRVVSEASGTYEEVIKYKTSELVEVSFRYMESESSGAGFHFSALAKTTGNKAVDDTIRSVLSMVTGNLETVEL